MRLNELRKLVNETVRQEQRKSRTRKPRKFSSLIESTVRTVLREAEGDEEGQDQGGSTPNIGHKTNTGDEAAVKGLLDLLFDNPEGLKSLYDGLPATGKDDDGKDKFAWYAKKIGGLDVSEIESIRDAAFGSKEEALKGIGRVNKKLKAGKGFSKAYMPAFEGVDVKIVADALDASQGDLGVDFEKPWNKTHNFKEYMDDEEVQEKLKEAAVLNRWGKLAGLLNEQGGFKATEDMPFPGPAKTMPGAPAVGNNADTTPSSDQVKGVAKGYLTKGNEEMGADGSDVMTVDANTNIGHNNMVPTQREVKLLKTLAFALFDVGQEMGGAFVDNEGNILDGHHRWSGQELRGYSGQHSQVHMINRAGKFAGKGSTPRFLKLLSTISAAIGRPTKLK